MYSLTNEVRNAIDMGYGLVEVFEFLEYSVTFRQRNQFTRSFLQKILTCSFETGIIWLSILGSE